jgi:membrane protein implicated in regulation of membrane protease activity
VWILWLIVAVGLGVAEIFSGTFILLMLGAGALGASATALLGAPLWAQSLVFGLISILALVGVRPTLQHHLHAHAESAPMGLEAIEGSTGLVLERIDMDHGLIKIDGELWTARPYDATQSFETGDRVRVIEVRGATALVWKE